MLATHHSITLIVPEPYSPRKLRVLQNGVNSLMVSWSPQYSGLYIIVTGYYISYQEQDGGHRGSLMTGESNLNTTITGLIAGATYSISVAANSSDVLLQRHGLLPRDRNYLQQAIEKNEFHPSPVVEVTAAPRLVIVLPLEIEDGRVIPIPMIIDTGALAFMYLGTGCRWALAELSCLQRGVMLKNISLQLNHSESGSTAACLRSSSCYRNRDLSNALKLPQSLQTL